MKNAIELIMEVLQSEHPLRVNCNHVIYEPMGGSFFTMLSAYTTDSEATMELTDEELVLFYLFVLEAEEAFK